MTARRVFNSILRWILPIEPCECTPPSVWYITSKAVYPLYMYSMYCWKYYGCACVLLYVEPQGLETLVTLNAIVFLMFLIRPIYSWYNTPKTSLTLLIFRFVLLYFSGELFIGWVCWQVSLLGYLSPLHLSSVCLLVLLSDCLYLFVFVCSSFCFFVFVGAGFDPPVKLTCWLHPRI